MKSSLEVSEIGYLTWWNFPKKAWIIILGEIGVIASLSGLLYSTYLNDVYFQTYANGLSPILVPILSVAFGISSASIATYLYLGMKRIRTSRESEGLVKKRAHPRKTPKRALPPTSQPKLVEISSAISAKLKPIAPQSRVPMQHPTKEREEITPNSGNQKQTDASRKG